MSKNRFEGTNNTIPVEKHDTAAWANKEKLKNGSNVPVPSETQVINAKKYADTNEK